MLCSFVCGCARPYMHIGQVNQPFSEERSIRSTLNPAIAGILNEERVSWDNLARSDHRPRRQRLLHLVD